MLKRNKKEINSYKVFDVALLHCDNVDRGPSDPENIICIIISKRNGLFELGCKAGLSEGFLLLIHLPEHNLILISQPMISLEINYIFDQLFISRSLTRFFKM